PAAAPATRTAPHAIADHVTDRDRHEADLELRDRDHAVVEDGSGDCRADAEDERASERGPRVRAVPGRLERRLARLAQRSAVPGKVLGANRGAARLAGEAFRRRARAFTSIELDAIELEGGGSRWLLV